MHSICVPDRANRRKPLPRLAATPRTPARAPAAARTRPPPRRGLPATSCARSSSTIRSMSRSPCRAAKSSKYQRRNTKQITSSSAWVSASRFSPSLRSRLATRARSASAVAGLGHHPGDALGMRPRLVGSPGEIAGAPLRIVAPRDLPALDVLAPRRDPQVLRRARKPPRQLLRHPLAIDERRRPPIGFAVRVGGIGGVDRREHGVERGHGAHHRLRTRRVNNASHPSPMVSTR